MNFWSVCLVPAGTPLLLKDAGELVRSCPLVPNCRNSVDALKWARYWRKRGKPCAIVPPVTKELPLP